VLRYNENEDLEYRFSEVDDVVERWRRRVLRVTPRVRSEFRERLMMSLIYHDAALEGDVLTYNEIKLALEASVRSEVAGASYESIKRYHGACVFIERATASQPPPFDLDALLALYAMLAPEEKAAGLPYRHENPLHRLYYHDIVGPEDIEAEMQELGAWLTGEDARALHPIERAAEAHLRLMLIFPWAKESGRTARILSNLILRRADYPVAVLHSIDRQAYYEALRGDREALINLYLEAVETTALSEIRVYDEADRGTRRAS
jgi:Fic family protein